MNLTIYFDGSGNAGSITDRDGWVAFGAWADGLEPDDNQAILHLWENGWEDDLESLEEQLAKALSSDPPDIPGVEEVVEELLDALEGRAEKDSALAITLGPESTANQWEPICH